MKKLVLVLLIGVTSIYAAQRNVCVEVFTATWCGYCPYAAYALDTLDAKYGDSLVVIKYHPSSSDPFYTDESVTRLLYYSVTGYPTTIFDGVETVVGGWSGMYGQFENVFNTRIGISSPLQITINVNFDAVTREGSAIVNIYAEQGIPSSSMLRYGIVEDSIFYTWEGRPILRDLLRDMVPDAQGIPLSLSAGETYVDTVNFTLGADWVDPYCYFVAFVQDDNTKEILQAQKARVPVNYGRLKLVSYSYSEITGDGNGRLEPGETVNLNLCITNSPPYGTARNASIAIYINDPHISLTDSIFAYDSIPVYDTVHIATTLEADPNTPFHIFPVVINMFSDNGFCDVFDTVYLKVGIDSLLVWDATYSPSYRDYVLPYLEDLGVSYELQVESDSGKPNLYSEYKYIVYLAGLNAPDTATLNRLESFLDNGGRLFITGQNIAEGLASSSFLTDYLKASFVKGSTGDLKLVGSGFLFNTQDTVLLAGSGSANNQNSKDIIDVIAPAQPVLYYNALSGSDADSTAGLAYDDGVKRVVFFAFGFEGVADASLNTISKKEVLRRVLNYLGYSISGIEENSRTVVQNVLLRRLEFFVPSSFVGGKGILYDNIGRVVKVFDLGSSHVIIPSSEIEPGVYFLMMKKGGDTKRIKFILVN